MPSVINVGKMLAVIDCQKMKKEQLGFSQTNDMSDL